MARFTTGVFDNREDAMRAVIYKEPLPIDNPNALLDVELSEPEPGSMDLLVRVEAVSVNPVDTKIRQGMMGPGPRVLGWDAVGVVDSPGWQ